MVLPKSLPDWVASDPKRSAEVAVYNALRNLPDGYRAYYHFPWVERSAGRPRASEGEADFIIAHPGKGILLIEVKGGRIGHDGASGCWTSTDRDGNVYQIDPFEQLRRCKHALISKLRACPLWRGSWVEVGHAVCFPHCAAGQWVSTADGPPEIIICGDELDHLEAKLEEVFGYWRETDAVRAPGPDGISALETVVAPTFVLNRYEAGLDLTTQEDRILRLTREQFDVLELLQQVPRVSVQGGAGTGKTLLAVEKARRASESGRRTLLVCFNRPLADHLRHSLTPASDLRVCTFHQLCHWAAVQAGGRIDEPYAREMPAKFYLTDLPMALFEATVNLPSLRFDTIVVDEGQDFHNGWWEILEYLLADDQQSELYVFFDGNQQISGWQIPLPRSMVPIKLTKNLRNTRQVFDLAKRYYGGEEYLSAGPDGVPVERVEARTPREVAQAISKILHRVVHEFHQPPSHIVILTARALASCSVGEAKRLGAFRLTSDHDGPPDAVLIETIQRFKGLERSVVILIDLDKALDDKELLYVGLSRARLLLFLVGARPIVEKLGPVAEGG